MAREGSRQGRKRGKASAAAESESPTSAAPVSSATEAEVAGLYEAAAAQGDGKEKKKTGGKGTGSPPAFDPRQLDSTVIALPLLAKMVGKGEEPLPSRRRGRAQAEDEEPRGLKAAYDVIIDLNLDYPGDRSAARAQVEKLIDELLQEHGIGKGDQGIYPWKAERSRQYVFAKLRGDLIQLLVQRDRAAAADGPEGKPMAAIYRIWPDFKVQALTTKSISTVKADAARNAFAATGAGIVWAVLDSGVDGHHPHFALHRSLELDPAMQHHDFTAMENLAAPESRARALSDLKGHGTHVAGIIAGQSVGTRGVNIMAEKNEVDQDGVSRPVESSLDDISGMAPRCKILSLKILNDDGTGSTSSIMAALDYIQELNGNGRRLLVHGVNLSVGYDFEPKWFACGQSPLCVEVDRLVRSGVVVVVAAGNTGYGWNESAFRGTVAAGMDVTINDPGNADLAITVGSTHREMPHVYGVSYFSSKGPTGDGRMKPDLVAPGEKIISCASSKKSFKLSDTTPSLDGDVQPKLEARYREDSGTSMAAPHVAGVIAAFLSIRREFIGKPDRVKEIFLGTATDLRRTPAFQGRGLVDVMRAIQSV